MKNTQPKWFHESHTVLCNGQKIIIRYSPTLIFQNLVSQKSENILIFNYFCDE